MTPPVSILILKLGDTLPELRARHGDFEHWMAQGLRRSGLDLQLEVADPRPHAAPPTATDTSPAPHGNLPRRHGLPTGAELAARGAGVLITGSHAMVTDREPWSETTATWLADVVARGLPVLGVCYGHQLLAHALGGEVWPHPDGLELGTVQVETTEHAPSDPLLGDLPRRFQAQVAHRQSVRRLPAGATVLARNGFEPHHAYRVGECAWGVQFHPEFGPQASQGYLQHLADDLQRQGQDPQALTAQVTPSPEAANLLARFAHQVAQRATPRP